MDNAINTYVLGKPTDVGDDYEIMQEYFHAMIDRIQDDLVDKHKKVC